MNDPATGQWALFTEPNGSGLMEEADAPRNAPLNNPNGNLQHLFYHSDYDPMEVAIGPLPISIDHPEIAAGTGPGGAATVNAGQVYGNHAVDHVLLNHGLGIVPDFMLLLGSHVIHPGFPVQYDSADGRARCVTAFATNSQIFLREFGVQTSNAMPALTVSYTILVLRQPPPASGDVLFEFEPDTGVVRMAREKFRSDRRYLQIVAGGSPFGLPTGRTLDLDNGTFCSVSPDGSVRSPVPAALRVSFGFGPAEFGPDGNYKGTFIGEPAVLVQAP